ncbi:hypothetical protein BD410DRAFT_794532 [Rickenella mellea]|uniref:Uncharacterized protein n=1 Tax=Rickenella mellea TaxID=50990 RepID=A0A4Y7PQE5_9AGAM|nr:hypothetical protein BD410DRAFT_794532 [Rickenella mellea]
MRVYVRDRTARSAQCGPDHMGLDGGLRVSRRITERKAKWDDESKPTLFYMFRIVFVGYIGGCILVATVRWTKNNEGRSAGWMKYAHAA